MAALTLKQTFGAVGRYSQHGDLNKLAKKLETKATMEAVLDKVAEMVNSNPILFKELRTKYPKRAEMYDKGAMKLAGFDNSTTEATNAVAQGKSRAAAKQRSQRRRNPEIKTVKQALEVIKARGYTITDRLTTSLKVMHQQATDPNAHARAMNLDTYVNTYYK
ncbi:hypothetical protein [Candidatus Neptunochlamydia vexilliferae]|uniref:Uncharacterized protein n=1 Tax=Candidatus Neptunichlamydia vexilliferae TaxID=1651774 RepID=A0ABS0AYY3_9BACT|nr:hypothetical protein [Candidatus Neptunochlamydia vexilliferae]MBF5059321.1 hypothetical protein [Candidatus Neptunochlamydia vexilliferae]